MAKLLKKYQSKSITPVDEYVCTLSEDVLKKANEVLGETPEIRKTLLKEFREWIWNNPRIEKCRMDAKFLLRFLRVGKYNMKIAKEMFERDLIFRQGFYGYDWLSNLDTQRPGIQQFINNGLLTFLPNYSKTGEKIILARCKACDCNIKDAGSVGMSLMAMVMDIFLEEEENQIHGYTLLVDLAGVRMSHYFLFNFSAWFRFLKNSERTLAARHVKVHVLNFKTIFLFAVKLVMRNTKQNVHEFLTFPSSTDDFDFVDKENLPQEYGGTHTMEELVEHIRQAINSRHEYFLSYKNFKVNEEFYTKPVLKCDTSTLNYRLVNKKGKLLKRYEENDEES